MNEVSVLDIRLYDQSIGTLTHLGGDRTIFVFDQGYINNVERPTLGLRFKDKFGDLLTEFRPYQTQLMPYFSNLLPEGALRRLLADKAGIAPEREHLLLKALGADLAGAVTAAPMEGEAFAGALKGEEDARAPRHMVDDVLRFSLAGVQLKFSAIQNSHKGFTIPVHGAGGQWIVKLPSPSYAHVPENEYSMMRLAQLMGMDVPEIGLVDLDLIDNLPPNIQKAGQKAFAIERFDRLPSGERVHIEDFAQVFDVYPHNKYERANMGNLAQVIAAESGLDDAAEFIKRVTFSVLIGNGDMHLKNWSLIYPDRVNARLAPAYDFVSTIAYMPNDQFALNFSRRKAFTDFTFEELDHIATKAALPQRMVRDVARDTVAQFMDVWSREKWHLPMHTNVMRAIDTHLATLPIII